MSEFDDPILRDRLSRYAGAPPDSDAAYLGVQQRVRHVKRRRVAIWSGAAAIVIGVGTANALQGPDGAKVTVPPDRIDAGGEHRRHVHLHDVHLHDRHVDAADHHDRSRHDRGCVHAAGPAGGHEPGDGAREPGLGRRRPAGAPPAESATASRPAAPPSASEDDERPRQ